MKDFSFLLSRRRFLAALAAVPGLGWLAGCQAPPARTGVAPQLPNAPTAEEVPKRQVAVKAGDLKGDWAVTSFDYRIATPSSSGMSVTHVPGYAVRFPQSVDAQGGIHLFSRICTHLSCNVNAVAPDQTPLLEQKYGFRQGKPGTAYLACPCHFSVFDLSQRDAEGRYGAVQSGPAPRAPRIFTYKIEKGDVVITGLEEGGIA